MKKIKKIFITGVCGFIGSNYLEFFSKFYPHIELVGVDNLKVGKIKYIKKYLDKKNFKFYKTDLKDRKKIIKIMKNVDLVIHLASNADIAKAVKDPLIDYVEGFNLTLNVLEAMRKNKVKNLIFASGSGVYEEKYKSMLIENSSNLKPISTYGANKLSSESFISAYSHLYNINSLVFRFANVVGKNQTHGVAYDFKNKLIDNSNVIKVMGNGSQTKSYVDVNDIINATIRAFKKNKKNYDIFNISNDDRISVKEILKLVISDLNLKKKPKIIFGKTTRGWSGDVPFIKLSNKKIKKIGWNYKFNSKEAIINSLKYI